VGNEPPDPAAGYWEFPGGCLEPGETALQAAKREWMEETGLTLPAGTLMGRWDASNGKYRGFVWTVANESDVPIHDGRDDVANPDDPDGDKVESIAWWDPSHLANNPAVRPELEGDLDDVLTALGAVAKAATSQVEGPAASAADVRAVMADNFPAKALTWLDDASWQGPMTVPLSEIDFTGDDTWAADHETSKVDEFMEKIKAGQHLNPIILVDTPGQHDLMIVDGHHRALAYRALGESPICYVGTVSKPSGPWDETHSYQVHQGPSQANKSAETGELSTVHKPLGTHGLWGSKTEQLPAYIQNVAHALIDDGHDESSAIAIAVGTMKRWAAGGGKVTPEVRAAATKALAEWEKLKAEHASKAIEV
jgi:ADP-ribose pyrophosphatase YjhB (NUDIX family)